MIGLSNGIRGCWIAIGDFNNVMNSNERVGGNPVSLTEMQGMRRCVDLCELQDLKQQGLWFTWSNKQVGGRRIYSKIDRALVNGQWIIEFPHSYVTALVEGVSDHCPLVLRLTDAIVKRHKPFKYYNVWNQSKDFLKLVEESWREPVEGKCMFPLVRKLKRLKPVFKKLNKGQFADIPQKVELLRRELETIQEQIQGKLDDEDLMEYELVVYREYIQSSKAYESFLQQKAKELWGKQGDSNSSYFHAKLRIRTMKNRINSIVGANGAVITDWNLVRDHFIGCFQHQLGQNSSREVSQLEIFQRGHVLNWQQQVQLVKQVSKLEVKNATGASIAARVQACTDMAVDCTKEHGT
ncbi:OLC1v1023953C1 [Oldenlandia corymbosa var. corymbosa]|uniref:OLC1v1023953C1 n=1 Tax=Oldenlandia corymbosa var. corymbosa TaxID=529605 RepID=A0AAV1C4P1_OLDCO|nr:OLC1v1023953C1 [Oldenlandia corymbosa var. corymbosa]